MTPRVVARTLAAGWLLLAGLASAQPRGLAVQGEALFMAQGCHGCHTVGRAGTPIGPDLSHIGAKYPESYLLAWLGDPSRQRPTAHMPKIQMAPAEAEALAAYLASLR